MKKHSENINRNKAKKIFSRKDKETLDTSIKNKPRRDIRQIQKALIEVALYSNKEITVGEFGKFHNKILKEMK